MHSDDLDVVGFDVPEKLHVPLGLSHDVRVFTVVAEVLRRGGGLEDERLVRRHEIGSEVEQKVERGGRLSDHLPDLGDVPITDGCRRRAYVVGWVDHAATETRQTLIAHPYRRGERDLRAVQSIGSGNRRL